MQQLTLFDQQDEYQPRFQAYLDYSGKSNPSELKHMEFRIWISKHHSDFKAQKGMREFQPLSKNQQNEFTEYLFKMAKAGG